MYYQTDSHRIIEKILNSELRDQSSIEDAPEYASHDPNQQIVEMVIELDSEQSATIQIHPDDDPFLLAKAFCFQYSIDPRVINTLANNIRNVKNMEFHNNSLINHHFSNLIAGPNPNNHHMTSTSSNNPNHNKSKLSSSMIDQRNDHRNDPRSNKQNNPSLANQSVNQSFNKAVDTSINTKNRTLDRSSMVKHNDTTMMSNGFSRQSVFDRLYQDSRKKKTQKNGIQTTQKKDKKISQSILEGSNLSQDPCLLIYEKNTKMYQSAIMKREELNRLNEEKLTEHCTFKPEINPISQIIAKKLPQSYRSERKRENDIKRIQKFLQEKEQKQLEECTFEPRTLNKSRSRSKSAERYKILYQESKIREMKRKESMESLKNSRNNKSNVKINKISECIVGNKTFYERLKEDEQKRVEKKRQMEYEVRQEQNRAPSTGRGPSNRPRNISIGEHLYNQARNRSIQKQKQIENISLLTQNKMTCKQSQKIYENRKKTAFEYIFAVLDSDEDGLISNTKIQLNRLPVDVLKLLAPLLIEMEEIGAELDEGEFVQALERLFKGFSVEEKQKVLQVFKTNTGSKSSQEDMPSFKPQLNEKSIRWAQGNRPQRMDLYELWKETQVEKQEKLQEIRAYKVLSELEQCTFHPLLFR